MTQSCTRFQLRKERAENIKAHLRFFLLVQKESNKFQECRATVEGKQKSRRMPPSQMKKKRRGRRAEAFGMLCGSKMNLEWEFLEGKKEADIVKHILLLGSAFVSEKSEKTARETRMERNNKHLTEMFLRLLSSLTYIQQRRRTLQAILMSINSPSRRAFKGERCYERNA